MANKNKSNQPVLSIITVVFNGASLIETTINSILNQAYQDLEYIIIDGDSTDGTIAIIRKYASQLSYWISEPDQGIYDAMNKGLKAARGNYVLFINAGDQLNSTITLSSIFNSKLKNPDIIYGETNLIDARGEILGTRSQLTTRKLPEKLNKSHMLYGMVVSHQSFMVKRKITPFYDLQYKCSADIDWVIRCLRKGKSIHHAQTIIAKYLVGGYSIRNKKNCWKERFTIYKNHYGLGKTLAAHVHIIFRYLKFKLSGKRNY